VLGLFFGFGGLRGGGALATDRDFTGQTLDGTTELTHMGARDYDAVTMTFTSADTMTPGTKAAALNRYAYVAGNPLRFSDTSGHCIDGRCNWSSNPNAHDEQDSLPPGASIAPSNKAGPRTEQKRSGPRPDGGYNDTYSGSFFGLPAAQIMRGAFRRWQHGDSWGEGDVDAAIADHIGETLEPEVVGGKLIWTNAETGVQVVYDVAGDYYRVFNPATRQYYTTKGTWDAWKKNPDSHYRNSGEPQTAPKTAPDDPAPAPEVEAPPQEGGSGYEPGVGGELIGGGGGVAHEL